MAGFNRPCRCICATVPAPCTIRATRHHPAALSRRRSLCCRKPLFMEPVARRSAPYQYQRRGGGASWRVSGGFSVAYSGIVRARPPYLAGAGTWHAACMRPGRSPKCDGHRLRWAVSLCHTLCRLRPRGGGRDLSRHGGPNHADHRQTSGQTGDLRGRAAAGAVRRDTSPGCAAWAACRSGRASLRYGRRRLGHRAGHRAGLVAAAGAVMGARATIVRPRGGGGIGPVVGPWCPSPADALAWATGYCKPGPAFPVGTTVTVDGLPGVYIPVWRASESRNVLRPLGRPGG